MWNKETWNAWREPDQDAIAEEAAPASSSEAVKNHLISAKRQRRPSVRLEEIGNRPAAFIAKKRRKKIGFFMSSQSINPRVRDVSDDLEVEECDVANSYKKAKVQPLVLASSGSLCEHTLSDHGSDEEKGIVRTADFPSPCGLAAVESLREPHQASDDAIIGTKSPQFLKIFSKKGRNGNRKRGGPKAAASLKKLSSTTQLSVSKKVPHMKDVKDMHSDGENDAHTPEGFRDCDLETSDFNDAKEMSNSQESKPLRGDDMASVQQQECQPKHVSEECLLRQEQERTERSKERYPSRQVSEECLQSQDQELLEMNEDRAGNTGIWTGTAIGQQAYESMDGIGTQVLSEGSMPPHDNNVKFPLEANVNQEGRELATDNAELHLASHGSPLPNGVLGWLQNLGLGKYAQHFEAHEVDSEVLPLLTFDDLKEMGIGAVGSRRKLFYAIQQLGKCLLVKAD